MSLCDFSNNLQIHGYIVGILLILGYIGSLGESYHNKNATDSNTEGFNRGSTDVATIFVGLACVIVYWYGFLKRNRPCILVSMVFVALGVIGSIIILIVGVVAVIAAGWPGLIFVVLALICIVFEVYLWQVMTQLRQSFLNDPMPNARTDKNMPV